MFYSQRAFTLIELTITLFIIGILVAINIPMLKNFLEQTDEKLMQAKLLRAIEFAQSESRRHQLPVTVCKSKNHKQCSGDWKDGWIIFLDPKKAGVVKNKNQILTVMQISSKYANLYWRSFPRYRNYLLFLPYNNFANDNGTFWYCRLSMPNPSWAIVLNQFGRARIVYPDHQGKLKDQNGKLLLC